MNMNVRRKLGNSFVCVILASVLGCSKNSAPSAQAGGMQAMPVKVMEAEAMPVNDATEYVATLKSRDSAVIMPQVEGRSRRFSCIRGIESRRGAP